MKARQKIYNYIKLNSPISIDLLANEINISRQYIHKVFNDMLENDQIYKMGKAPHVFYYFKEETEVIPTESISYENELFLKEHLLLIDARGQLLEGKDALTYWTSKQDLDFRKTINEYITTRKKYLSHYNEKHIIDGMVKLKATKGINTIGLDELYYLDFYAIERFGKTRLGTLMHFAKQGQNKKLMHMVVNEIKNRIHFFVESEGFDAIGFVPPSISRKTQIMDFLAKHLAISLPKIKIIKVKNEIVIPQKALSNIFERVDNAKHTFDIPVQKTYNKILLIDDAVGSGATMNEIALKIKHRNLAHNIVGMAITGSYKGFEVINEL